MSLVPLTDRNQIRKAFLRASATLKRDSQSFSRKVGWHGGGGDFQISWLSKDGLWFFLDDEREQTRYWMAFGTTDPADAQSLTIVGEINPTKEGIDRKNAGMFVQDERGTVYLAHSGKVGGSRKGIGKSSFVNSYAEPNVENIQWPDGRITSAIIIGTINGNRLPAQVAQFIKIIERYKKQFAQHGEIEPTKTDFTFTPEFSGQRQGYVLPSEVESRCDHGLVVSALAKLLSQKGIKIANTRSCDLFVVETNNKVAQLFEVKTETGPTGLYTGIGQLMLHGVSLETTKRVLVIPYKPPVETLRAIRKLGIRVVNYDWVDGLPNYHNLFQALR
jgi:hypothetical protein